MKFLENAWGWIGYNRNLVVLLVLGLALWIGGYSCTAFVDSPMEPGRQVNENELAVELKRWEQQNELMIIKFEAAALEVEKIKEGQNQLAEIAVSVAGGGVADLPGLLKIILASGGIGSILDNIRKRGVIAGLKKNQ